MLGAGGEGEGGITGSAEGSGTGSVSTMQQQVRAKAVVSCRCAWKTSGSKRHTAVTCKYLLPLYC